MSDEFPGLYYVEGDAWNTIHIDKAANTGFYNLMSPIECSGWVGTGVLVDGKFIGLFRYMDEIATTRNAPHLAGVTGMHRGIVIKDGSLQVWGENLNAPGAFTTSWIKATEE